MHVLNHMVCPVEVRRVKAVQGVLRVGRSARPWFSAGQDTDLLEGDEGKATCRGSPCFPGSRAVHAYSLLPG